MSKKMITFKINNGTKSDYTLIFNEIKKITNIYCQINKRTILVKTKKSSLNLREIIMKIDIEGSFEKIFICEWEHPCAWMGLTQEQSDWLKNN